MRESRFARPSRSPRHRRHRARRRLRASGRRVGHRRPTASPPVHRERSATVLPPFARPAPGRRRRHPRRTGSRRRRPGRRAPSRTRRPTGRRGASSARSRPARGYSGRCRVRASARNCRCCWERLAPRAEPSKRSSCSSARGPSPSAPQVAPRHSVSHTPHRPPSRGSRGTRAGSPCPALPDGTVSVSCRLSVPSAGPHRRRFGAPPSVRSLTRVA